SGAVARRVLPARALAALGADAARVTARDGTLRLGPALRAARTARPPAIARRGGSQPRPPRGRRRRGDRAPPPPRTAGDARRPPGRLLTEVPPEVRMAHSVRVAGACAGVHRLRRGRPGLPGDGGAGPAARARPDPPRTPRLRPVHARPRGAPADHRGRASRGA